MQSQGLAKKPCSSVKKISQDLCNPEAGTVNKTRLTNQPTTSIWDKEQLARRNREAVRPDKKYCQNGCL